MKQKSLSFGRRALSAACACVLTAAAGLIGMPASAADFARVSVHDPSVVKLADGSYYIIGSHLGAGRSDDLMNWRDTANSAAGSTKTTFFRDIYSDLAIPNAWANTSAGYDLSGNLWAPDIVWNSEMQKYCMYLSVNGVDWHSSIVLCTADDIDGPYTYQGTVVYSGFETSPANAANSYRNTDVERVLGANPDLSRYLTSAGRWNAEYGTNAIDPGVFYDEAGNLWMVYGSWFGGIYMLELDEQTGLRDYSVTYAYNKNYADPYMGTHIAGGYWASGEGPYIKYMCPPGSSKGYYYLFLSYGYFHPNGGYNMRVFRSEYPAGPYVDENGNSPIFTRGTDNIGGNTGMRLMSNYKWSCNGYSFKAQGHNSALMDDDGKLFVVYHTKFGGLGLFHQVRVHQLIMNEDGWITAAPYEYNGESLSQNGHTMAAMAGDYEFLVHTLDQGYKADWSENENNDTTVGLATPVSVKLNADGTVTGDATGKWSVNANSPYMQITVGNVTYKGAFLVQQDESDAMVTKMTFTATGNNMCVWGSKKTAYSFTEDLVQNQTASLLTYSGKAQEASSAVRLGDTALLADVPYRIESRFSGMVLDLAGGKAENGTNIQQWGYAPGSAHQEWRLCNAGGGYVSIRSAVDEDYALTMQEDNAEVQAYTGADNQLFRLIEKRGSYGIVSKASAEKTGLDVYGWSTEAGGNIAAYEYWGGDCQLWNLIPTCGTVPEGSYYIKSVNSGNFLNTDAAGSVIQTADAAVWQVTAAGSGFRLTGSSGAVGFAGAVADGTDVVLTQNGTDLTLYANADGSYTIMADGTEALDVYNISKESGANICLWNFWGGDGQKWVLVPAETAAQQLRGDLNADGAADLADAVLLQRWLLAVPDTVLPDWQAGDMNGDGRLNAADLTLLKRVLL